MGLAGKDGCSEGRCAAPGLDTEIFTWLLGSILAFRVDPISEPEAKLLRELAVDNCSGAGEADETREILA